VAIWCRLNARSLGSSSEPRRAAGRRLLPCRHVGIRRPPGDGWAFVFSDPVQGRRGKRMEFEIGIGKTARRAYGFDEVAIVPSRRTRDPEDVSIAWEIDAYTLPLPMMAAAMDAAVSPATAVEIGRIGGLPRLNLQGLRQRSPDPHPTHHRNPP